jgi:hypothetical protein
MVTRTVPVRAAAPVLAVNSHVMVPLLLPLAPEEMESQSPPDVTAAVQRALSPHPVLITANVVVLAVHATLWLAGVTESTGGHNDCVTVTSTGLPIASFAVTVMVPIRWDVVVLAVNAHVIVPLLFPLSPEVMESQDPPEVTSAVQGMVPVPLLDTLKVVVPTPFATF